VREQIDVTEGGRMRGGRDGGISSRTAKSADRSLLSRLRPGPHGAAGDGGEDDWDADERRATHEGSTRLALTFEGWRLGRVVACGCIAHELVL
jgi:hypothetical protein